MAEAKDDTLLRPGGTLSMVSEYPNVKTAHEWLPALGSVAKRGVRSGDASGGGISSEQPSSTKVAELQQLLDVSEASARHLLRSSHDGKGEGLDVSSDAATSRSGLAFAVCFEPVAHVQSAREYAADRADERGWPWANVQSWEESLRAHGVDHMGSGLVFAVKRGGAESSGACCPLRGPSREEDLSLLESSGEVVRAIRDALERCSGCECWRAGGPCEKETTLRSVRPSERQGKHAARRCGFRKPITSAAAAAERPGAPGQGPLGPLHFFRSFFGDLDLDSAPNASRFPNEETRRI